jgi:hypothetical protein
VAIFAICAYVFDHSQKAQVEAREGDRHSTVYTVHMFGINQTGYKYKALKGTARLTAV